MTKKLRPKQRLFVEYYAKNGFNGAKAARQAGYSAKTARQIAQKLLTSTDIQEAVKEQFQKVAMQPDEIIAHLSEIARGSLGQFLDDDQIINLAQAVESGNIPLLKKIVQKTTTRKIGETDVTSVRLEIELWDRLSALEKLGRYWQMFTEKMDVTSNGQTINLVWPKSSADDNDTD